MTHRLASLQRAALLSGALVFSTSALVSAQTPGSAPSVGAADEPTFLGTPAFANMVHGKNVWITADGVRREGHITSFSTSALTLVEDGATYTIPFKQIMRVEKTAHHLRKGTLIGLVAGAGLGLASAAGLCADEYCYASDYVLFTVFYGGIGAAAGVGIGAIVKAVSKHGQIIYDARRQTTVSLAPILSPTRKGVALSMTWR